MQSRDIAEPGIYSLPVDAYHLDPSAVPSMSASNAETMLSASARHVWQMHPRLNIAAAEDLDPEKMDSQSRTRMEHGSALHTLILGAGRPIVVVDGDDYRTGKAKQMRLDAHHEGAIPILASHKPKLIECARAVAEQVKDHPELRRVLEAPGRAEQTMLWEEPIGTGRRKTSIRCRALADWLPDDPLMPLLDFKFTTIPTAPQSYARTVREEIALRSVHYTRGAQRLRNRAPRGYWIVAVEVGAPFGLTVFDADQTLIHQAREQWAEAAAQFAACMNKGTRPADWPFWRPLVHMVGANSFQQRDWEDRKLMEGIKPARNGQISLARTRDLMAAIGGPVQ